MNNSLENTMQELAKSLTIMNYDYTDFKKDTMKKLNEHDEILQKRVYITSGKARTLQEKVKEKVRNICVENNLDYKKNRSKILHSRGGKVCSS